MKIHDVQMIDFDGTRMILGVDGQIYHIELPSISPRLAGAKDATPRSYSISPSGYGIHWPEIDEDLSVDGLIASANREEPKTVAPLVLHERPREKSDL
jgi:hypothetical protein